MPRCAVIALSVVIAWCGHAFALNPSLDVGQYAHSAWTTRDGTLNGEVRSVAQTADGYLWVGTESGLLRFDGARFVPWQPPGALGPFGGVDSLLVSRDGRLWIGSANGLVSWKDGNLTSYQELAGQKIDKVLEDREGTVWVGSQAVPTGRLCEIRGTAVRCYGQDGSLSRAVLALAEYGGSIWVTTATGLWQWRPGPTRQYSLGIQALDLGDYDGRLIIASDKGLLQLTDEKLEPYPIPLAGTQFYALRLMKDRDGGLWIGTAGRGLIHVHEGRTDFLDRADGLSGDIVYGFFQDREGDIWVTTNEGLDRFRSVFVSTVSVKQGLSSDARSVLADTDGSIWLGTTDGLNHWSNGRVNVYRKRNGMPDDVVQSLSQDDRARVWVATGAGVSRLDENRFFPATGVRGYVWSMAGTAANFWISSVDQGLLHLQEGRQAEQIPWAALGRKDIASALLDDPSNGGLWLGFYQGAVAYFKNGQVQRWYREADGLGSGWVWHLRLDSEGAIWASTAGGLSRIKNNRIATLTSANGLPCNSVQWAIEDDDHFLWLYAACGLVRIARAELDAWVMNPKYTIRPAVFDSSDGVRLHPTPISGYSPHVAKASDGRLWFTAGGGASVIDPRHIPFNSLPPPVHIERVTSDRSVRWQNSWGTSASNLRLPALSRDLQIDYTALSLSIPEKIRFKYKLEGYDRDWQEAANRRQAFYTNLSPRNYRFRVIASNNSGLWNEAGDTLEFSIAPAYYQTSWFLALIASVALATVWGVYRLRLHQIAREYSVRVDERVGERTRIARDLHDTLLQSFQGSLFEFQAARNLLQRRPEDAIHTLDDAISSAEAAITEGRNAIQDLRSASGGQSDLAHLLTASGKELAVAQDSNGSGTTFRLTVEGPPQTLSPVLQDEVYRIGREILRNSFRHARAGKIEVEIRYDDRMLRLRIRDDGIGIDPKVLKEGVRPGHWGLPGVRERAKLVGAKLDFWSEAGAGTEVQVTIPAAVAYSKSPDARVFGLFRKATKSHAE